VLASEYRFERISPQHISGSGDLTQRPAENPAIGNSNLQIRVSIDAVFLAASCDQSKQQLAAFVKRGADPAVLSFFPWRSDQAYGRFRGILDYNWTADPRCGTATSGGCVVSPIVSYVGGLPGAVISRGVWFLTFFDGTDGRAIYVTVTRDSDGLAHHYRIEHSGKATIISAIPKGLRGGDESRGSY
jgi:hypothetical protein